MASAQGARIQLDHLNYLADKADKVVDVTVDSSMLKQATSFLGGKDAKGQKVTELLQNVTGVYVKGFEFKGPAPYTQKDIEAIRKQVSGSNWSRVVSVREQNEMAEVYFFKQGNENGGLVVIAAEPNELTVVNIVGRIDLAALAAIGPMIPRLPEAAAAAVAK
jgi:hypothetical protein